MINDEIAFGLLSPADEGAFDALYRIYLEAIPPSERKPRRGLREMLGRPEYVFVVARLRERVIGFAILFSSARAGVALLEYFAIDVSLRGRGLGGRLFEEVARVVHGGDGDRPLLLEVESDLEAAPERALRARRIAFYRRWGCRRIEGLSYLLPLDVAGSPPAMELLLLARPMPDRLPLTTLRDWLVAIYRDVYGRQANDPRIERMLAELPAWLDVR